MAVTHLANVADRIDRSYSPRGGREERELEFGFKELLNGNEEPPDLFHRPDPFPFRA